MDFNPDTWGTVADWVGGLGTTAAFIATAAVIYRDAQVRRIAQARKVFYVSEIRTLMAIASPTGQSYGGGTTSRYTLTNMSDEPIYKVSFYPQRNGALRTKHSLAKKDVVLPEQSVSYETSDLEQPPLVVFRDNSGEPWVRTVGGQIWHYRKATFTTEPGKA